MAGVSVQVIYDPDGTNTDISNNVILKSARLSSSVASQPGMWQATVKDIDRTLDFTTGKRVIWKLDGATFYSGFLTQVSRTFAFPAVKTTSISDVKTREFILRGVDYNILFDKRVLRNTSNYLKKIPAHDRDYDGNLINVLCADYLDLPTWLNTTTEVENVAYMPTAAGHQFAWSQQGSAWRTQMDVFSKKAGGIYYIRPYGTGARLVYKALEDNAAPYALSDKPSGGDQGFRELDYLEDATGVVNDAFVWGGDTFGNTTGSPVVFSRDKNDTSISTHGRWQWAETHFGDSNYASQDEVDTRAAAIVEGRTGDTVHDQNRGLQNPNKTFTLAWHQRNIPVSGGHYQFITPGDLTTLKLYVFGDGVDPLIEVLPCRQIVASFPDNDPSGDAHVRFEGTFSIQVNDPWQLWQAIKRRRAAIT